MREALKLALDALEEAKTNDDGMEKWDRNKKAITAIKAALAQGETSSSRAAQEQQEPVAWERPIVYTPPHMAPPQPEERNFCSRCGKRTADLTVIHTCTPPQENT